MAKPLSLAALRDEIALFKIALSDAQRVIGNQSAEIRAHAGRTNISTQAVEQIWDKVSKNPDDFSNELVGIVFKAQHNLAALR